MTNKRSNGPNKSNGTTRLEQYNYWFNRRDEINRPVGNPRKRFLSKYLHNDVSGDDSLVDEGVEHDRPMHPGKISLKWEFT